MKCLSSAIFIGAFSVSNGETEQEIMVIICSIVVFL